MSIQRVLALSLAVYFVNFVGSANVMADDDVIVIEPDDPIVPEEPGAPIDDPGDGPTDDNVEPPPDPQDYDSGNPEPLPDEVKVDPPPPSDPTIFDQVEKKYDELETEGTFD